MGCIFCMIKDDSIPSHKVYEDDKHLAVLDIMPANEGHLVVFPKHHIPNIFELEDSSIIGVVARIARAVKAVTGCDGINILQNNGAAAGQTIEHLHFHIIPRFENDTVCFEWEKKNFGEQEFASFAAKIREAV